jgi:hypothetical protein
MAAMIPATTWRWVGLKRLADAVLMDCLVQEERIQPAIQSTAMLGRENGGRGAMNRADTGSCGVKSGGWWRAELDEDPVSDR